MYEMCIRKETRIDIGNFRIVEAQGTIAKEKILLKSLTYEVYVERLWKIGNFGSVYTKKTMWKELDEW